MPGLQSVIGQVNSAKDQWHKRTDFHNMANLRVLFVSETTFVTPALPSQSCKCMHVSLYTCHTLGTTNMVNFHLTISLPHNGAHSTM